jgi:peptidoglycan/xylan/chitin deacetylase (PgdA/CDA1 family)
MLVLPMRERVAGWLDRTGLLAAIMEARRRVHLPVLTVVTFHHVAEDDPAYPYDRGVADATPAQFRRHVEWIARRATPIRVDQLIAALDGAPLPHNAVLITFDDGYRSCHDLALPILRELGVPATFFIATGFVDQRRLYWWERIAVLLGQTRRATVQLRYPSPLTLTVADPTTATTLNDLIKDTHGLDLDRFLDELAAALDVPWSRAIEARYADGLIMTWDHVRALARAGMDVESHSRHHRVLQTLSDPELADDLAGSRRDLEAQLGRPVRLIAYPVGRRVHREDRIRNALLAAGYRAGLSNHSGVNPWWRRPIDPFDLRRLATDRAMSEPMFLTQIAVPPLAYVSSHNR